MIAVDTIDKLVDFYYKHENHNPDVELEDLRHFFSVLLSYDQIIIERENDEIVGYLEYFKLNYAQFGWIVCGNYFDIAKHNITDGNIAYFANVLIRPDKRKQWVVKSLKKEFFKRTADCEFITGHKNGKRYKPIAVFRRRRKA